MRPSTERCSIFKPSPVSAEGCIGLKPDSWPPAARLECPGTHAIPAECCRREPPEARDLPDLSATPRVTPDLVDCFAVLFMPDEPQMPRVCGISERNTPGGYPVGNFAFVI